MTAPRPTTTLLLARHAHASYVETWFSDEGGWLSPTGRAQADALAERVRDRDVAAIVSSDTSRAVQTAELVAARLGPGDREPVVTRRSLREVFVGDLIGAPFDVARLHEVTDHWYAGDLTARWPGGESGHDVVERHRAELETLVDRLAERPSGRTALVVAHQTALSIVVPALCGLPLSAGRDHPLANGHHAEVTRGPDGWSLQAWAG